MKAQSRGERAGTEAYVVVDPVRRTAVLVQPWYVRAYPDTDVRKRIDNPGQWVWFVLIDRRCPINGHATQDQAEKDWHVQPVAAPRQQMMPANYTHAGLIPRRECSDSFLIELGGMCNKFLHVSFERSCYWPARGRNAHAHPRSTIDRRAERPRRKS